MIVLNVFIAVIQVFIFIHLLEEIVSSVRNRKLQKEWADEKEMRLKCTPKITRAELCEYYVMFCKRNDCKVEF